MSSPSLTQLIAFVDLLQKFRAIERRVLVNKSDRKENDVEHSYSLTMLAWYIHSTYKLSLDINKVLKYALAHDLVEVYAGDTFFYTTDEQVISDKHEREKAASIKLRNEFPEFSELHDLIETYEKREDQESKFVYALDKIEPIFNIYLDKGRTWKVNDVSLEMLISLKSTKISVDATIEKIFIELIEKVKEDRDELFNKN